MCTRERVRNARKSILGVWRGFVQIQRHNLLTAFRFALNSLLPTPVVVHIALRCHVIFDAAGERERQEFIHERCHEPYLGVSEQYKVFIIEIMQKYEENMPFILSKHTL